MSNSKGSSQERRTLAYFDRLPRSAREAVRDARFDWALRPWLAAFEAGRMSARERLKVWGPDYPVLPGELPTPSRARRRR